MSNDLISRSALMNHLSGNVFIDVTPALEQAIKDEPATYDVDKVVETLEKEIKNNEKNKYQGSAEFKGYLKGIATGYRYALDIVKAGGADE